MRQFAERTFLLEPSPKSCTLKVAVAGPSLLYIATVLCVWYQPVTHTNIAGSNCIRYMHTIVYTVLPCTPTALYGPACYTHTNIATEQHIINYVHTIVYTVSPCSCTHTHCLMGMCMCLATHLYQAR